MTLSYFVYNLLTRYTGITKYFPYNFSTISYGKYLRNNSSLSKVFYKNGSTAIKYSPINFSTQNPRHVDQSKTNIAVSGSQVNSPTTSQIKVERGFNESLMKRQKWRVSRSLKPRYRLQSIYQRGNWPSWQRLCANGKRNDNDYPRCLCPSKFSALGTL